MLGGPVLRGKTIEPTFMRCGFGQQLNKQAGEYTERYIRLPCLPFYEKPIL